MSAPAAAFAAMGWVDRAPHVLPVAGQLRRRLRRTMTVVRLAVSKAHVAGSGITESVPEDSSNFQDWPPISVFVQLPPEGESVPM